MDKSEERYLKNLDESLKKISKSLEKLVKLEEVRTFPKRVHLEESSELKEDIENEWYSQAD